MSRFWHYRIAHVPLVWWQVCGRQQFGREPLMIRKSWRVGCYNKTMRERHLKLMRYVKR